MKKNSIYFLIE
jgi:hypothetical protein